jgi:tetratricopeptide (TPR) repeat protein
MRRTFLGLLFFSVLLSPTNTLAMPQEANSLEEARRILREASQLVKDIPEGQQFSAVANIAGQLARYGDLPSALATVRILKKPVDQALPLGIVAWSLDQAGNGVGALNLLESSDLGQNKAQAYQQLALSHLDRGDFSGALQTMNLVEGTPYLRLDMFVRIAQQKGKSGDMAGAREAIREALGVAEGARKEDSTCLMQLVGIAGAQAEIGDQAGALDTLNRFSEIVHQLQPGEGVVGKDSLLQQLAMGQARMGDLLASLHTIDELPEGSPRDLALMNVADQEAKNGDFQQAVFEVSLIADANLKTVELRQIAVLEGTSGKPVEALEAINRISNIGDRVYALATLALEQADKGNPTAGATLQLAVQAADEPGVKVEGHVFEFIAVTQALLKDFPGAHETVASMSEAESRVWPLWNITAMMAEAGDVQGALLLAANEQAAHPKAYALLGTAQGIFRHLQAESKANSNGKHEN